MNPVKVPDYAMGFADWLESHSLYNGIRNFDESLDEYIDTISIATDFDGDVANDIYDLQQYFGDDCEMNIINFMHGLIEGFEVEK